MLKGTKAKSDGAATPTGAGWSLLDGRGCQRGLGVPGELTETRGAPWWCLFIPISARTSRSHPGVGGILSVPNSAPALSQHLGEPVSFPADFGVVVVFSQSRLLQDLLLELGMGFRREHHCLLWPDLLSLCKKWQLFEPNLVVFNLSYSKPHLPLPSCVPAG